MGGRCEPRGRHRWRSRQDRLAGAESRKRPGKGGQALPPDSLGAGGRAGLERRRMEPAVRQAVSVGAVTFSEFTAAGLQSSRSLGVPLGPLRRSKTYTTTRGDSKGTSRYTNRRDSPPVGDARTGSFPREESSSPRKRSGLRG